MFFLPIPLPVFLLMIILFSVPTLSLSTVASGTTFHCKSLSHRSESKKPLELSLLSEPRDAPEEGDQGPLKNMLPVSPPQLGLLLSFFCFG